MTDERVWGPGKIWAARRIVLAVFFAFWEWAAHSKLIDPILIGKPTGIVQYLWQEVFVTQSLLNDFYWSMGGTMIAFVLGSVAGVLVGMLFVTSPSTEAVLNPIFTALNAIDRFEDYRRACVDFHAAWKTADQAGTRWYQRWEGWLTLIAGLATAIGIWYVIMAACVAVGAEIQRDRDIHPQDQGDHQHGRGKTRQHQYARQGHARGHGCCSWRTA